MWEANDENARSNSAPRLRRPRLPSHPVLPVSVFLKIGDRSSEFYPNVNEIRRDGSFVYESFVETQGTDVKVCDITSDGQIDAASRDARRYLFLDVPDK